MKRGTARGVLALLLFAVLISSPFVFAGFGDWWGKITGRATTNTTSVSITIASGGSPLIFHVDSITAQTPNTGTTKSVAFVVNVSDVDGSGNINSTATNATFSRSGETNRTDALCTLQTEYAGDDTKSFSCSIDLQYYDGAGTWDVTVEAADLNGLSGINLTTSFTYNSLNAMNMTPTAATFPGVTTASKNVTADSNFTIYNLGNVDVDINVSATDLPGFSTPGDVIYAENFTLTTNTTHLCDGTWMINDTFVEIADSALNAGGPSYPTQDITLCLRHVNPTLSAQVYNSSYGDWIVGAVPQ